MLTTLPPATRILRTACAAWLPITLLVVEPRTILYDEYMEAEGQRIGLKLLLVFVHADRYDGHLWFSSAQLLEEAPR